MSIRLTRIDDSLTFVNMWGETELAAVLCTLILGGAAEVRHDYVAAGEARHIRVDCETADAVYEVGLDSTRSAFDSVHQVLIAAHLTGKRPVVAMIDTNGREEAEEYQVRLAARAAGVDYLTIRKQFLIRWRMTWPFRARPAPGPAIPAG